MSRSSFVPYKLVGDRAFLGKNLFIATTTETGQRRICDNCINRCSAVGDGIFVGKKNNMTSCCSDSAKKAFGITENVIMAKELHGQPVANFCTEFVEIENTTTTTDQPVYASSNTTEDVKITSNSKAGDGALFLAPKNGKYYYPADYNFPKTVKHENLLKFNSLDDAINSGRLPVEL